MKRLILLISLITLSITTWGQSWNNTGNSLQRKIASLDTSYRFNLGTPGFMYLYTRPQLTNIINAINAVLSTKAVDTTVVHKAQTETIVGDKIFQGLNTFNQRLYFNTTGQDSVGLYWAVHSDFGKIFLESTGDHTEDSNLIFEQGDNITPAAGSKEGFTWRKNGSGDLPTPTPNKDIAHMDITSFTWMGKQVALSKTVATYADMLADGVPLAFTTYKILNDEHKSLTNTTYQWWPDGTRMYLTTTTD